MTARPYRPLAAVRHTTRQNSLLRVRALQSAGISLITLSILNTMFLQAISIRVNVILICSGVFLLWLSFWIWQVHRRRRQRMALLQKYI